jgi:soluble lytic murein transglycosylase
MFDEAESTLETLFRATPRHDADPLACRRFAPRVRLLRSMRSVLAPMLAACVLTVTAQEHVVRPVLEWGASRLETRHDESGRKQAASGSEIPPAVRPSTPGIAEHAAILDLVRSHRRTASEAWRRQLADAIFSESVAAEVDPLMVAAIVAKESSFKSRIVSSAGAVGLMQLRPFVARDVAQRRAIEWAGRETLHQPELNVRLGILYYKELVERFDGNTPVALTDDNYGPTRVARQLRDGTYSDSLYAHNVLRLYDRLNGDRSSGWSEEAEQRG